MVEILGKIPTKTLKITGLILAAIYFTSCSNSTSDGEAVFGNKVVSEFTAFHPVTGQPLGPEDLDAELLKEDEDPVSVENLNGGIEVKEIHPVDVDVVKEKDSMLFGWDPKGEYNSHISASCHFSNLEEIINNQDGMTSNLTNSLQSWSQRCEKELSRYRTNNLTTVIRFSTVNYDINSDVIKKVNFAFDDGTVLEGLLAMKPGTEKRPLVIFRHGIYGDAADSGVFRNFFMHLYEESPFHMLFLASVTGEVYSKQNGVLALGGLDEGVQIVKIADMLAENPNLSSKILDIHTVGVSLGSNGTLFSSLFSSYKPAGLSKIKSTIALCPVVNLEPTMKSVFEPSVRGIFYSILTRQILNKIYDYVPILKEVLNRNEAWTQEVLYSALSRAVTWYYERQTELKPIDVMPFTGNRIYSLEDFWQHNNFIKYAKQVDIPTLVIHARDDFLVKSDFNSDALHSELEGMNSNVGVLEFQNGSHCAVNVAQGWPTISSLLRTFILKHSDYRNIKSKIVSIVTTNSQLTETQQMTHYKFKTSEGSDEIKIEITYYDSKISQMNTHCRRYQPLFAPDICYRTKNEVIQIDKIGDIGIPQDKSESLRLARWLNTHAILLNENSNNILGTNDWPKKIKLTADYERIQ